MTGDGETPLAEDAEIAWQAVEENGKGHGL